MLHPGQCDLCGLPEGEIPHRSKLTCIEALDERRRAVEEFYAQPPAQTMSLKGPTGDDAAT